MRSLVVASLLGLMWACGYARPAPVGDDGGLADAEVGPATTIGPVSGDGQSGPPSTDLIAPLVVTVTDSNAKPVPHVGVSFVVTAGGGHVSVSSVDTNSLGQAQTTMTLGATFGTNTIEARASGLVGSPVIFTATAYDAPPTELSYTPNPAVYPQGLPITPNTPTNNGGAAVAYSIDGALPTGLAFDTKTGAISGTPSAPVPATTFTVEAKNTGGSTTTELSITVEAVPPSCRAPALACGPASDSCCASPVVPGGTFARSHDVGTDGAFPDTTFPATVSTFRLDRYEVTVGRFRAFVRAGMGTQANPPPLDAGAHPNIPGSGWQESFNAHLKSDTASLEQALSGCGSYTTWTATAGTNERRPITCLSWYEAMAFCAWDGGFLPTEAEWNYAAVGGDQYRAYPWSSPPATDGYGSVAIDCSFANYSGCGGSANDVGSESPKSDGRWGQAGLAGNVGEWTLDWDAPYSVPCEDCANLSPATNRIVRGGTFNTVFSPAYNTLLRGANRSAGSTDLYYAIFGIRCARIP